MVYCITIHILINNGLNWYSIQNLLWNTNLKTINTIIFGKVSGLVVLTCALFLEFGGLKP